MTTDTVDTLWKPVSYKSLKSAKMAAQKPRPMPFYLWEPVSYRDVKGPMRRLQKGKAVDAEPVEAKPNLLWLAAIIAYFWALALITVTVCLLLDSRLGIAYLTCASLVAIPVFDLYQKK